MRFKISMKTITRTIIKIKKKHSLRERILSQTMKYKFWILWNSSINSLTLGYLLVRRTNRNAYSMNARDMAQMSIDIVIFSYDIVKRT